MGISSLAKTLASAYKRANRSNASAAQKASVRSWEQPDDLFLATDDTVIVKVWAPSDGPSDPLAPKWNGASRWGETTWG